MERFTDILKGKRFYTYLKTNGIEEQNLITKMLEGFCKIVVMTWHYRGTKGGKFGV